jgi:hypothetical protein
MTQTKDTLTRQCFSSKKIILTCLCLLCCFASSGNGFAGERTEVVKNVHQIKAKSGISPQKRMVEVQQYLHRLPEEKLIQLTQEIGGERFLKQIPPSARVAKMKNGGTADQKNQRPMNNQELRNTLKSPEVRERYLNAVANYLLNTTK